MYVAAGNLEEGYTVTTAFMQDMLQRFKDQKLIHRRYAFAIIIQVCHSRLFGPTMRRLAGMTACEPLHCLVQVMYRHWPLQSKTIAIAFLLCWYPALYVLSSSG